MRLIQLRHLTAGRRVALVEGNRLLLLRTHHSVYELASAAIAANTPLLKFVPPLVSTDAVDYDDAYAGKSDWALLPAFDHPTDPSKLHVAGTGLTHVNSAKYRDAMHASTNAAAAPVTDSMRMFQWGIQGGKPGEGKIGAQPEWFYKGNGHILRAPNQPLDVPAFADDGGEEGELAGVYLIDAQGNPRRIGMAAGNEFADHQMERKNYLYLAPSKLRACCIGPELVIDFDFSDVKGVARIERAGAITWEKAIASGEANMSHSLENLEHHQFKYAQHRVPGEAHIHFWGADAFSFGSSVSLQDGDIMSIEWTGFGRALRNPIRIDRSTPKLAKVTPA